MNVDQIIQGDAIKLASILKPNSVDCIITSPPYFGLRDYGASGQIGLEETVDEYIKKLTRLFSNLKKALKDDGTLFIVIGDTYNGDKKQFTDEKNKALIKSGASIHKHIQSRLQRKNLLQVPARLALALQGIGLILRNEIIWQKPNAMPQSVKDRFTNDYEKILFFVKSEKYYFHQLVEPMKTIDTNPPRGSAGVKQANKGLRIRREFNRTVGSKKQDMVGRHDYSGFNNRYVPNKEYTRNRRCVWTIPTESCSVNHFAMFPQNLVADLIECGCKPGGVVLDPFMGSGTTAMVAKQYGRHYIGFELNAEYCEIAKQRAQNIKPVVVKPKEAKKPIQVVEQMSIFTDYQKA